jgi:hypothetical protein
LLLNTFMDQTELRACQSNGRKDSQLATEIITKLSAGDPWHAAQTSAA